MGTLKKADSEIISSYKDYLEVERGYSNYTVLNYIDDINDFKDYLTSKKIDSIVNVSVNIARYYVMELNKDAYKA